MSISKITAALASASNEITLAVANLNFNFSLVKLEAPVEFSAIGSKLSRRRIDEAENGSAHTTARRLGALFEEVIPPTPNLIRAYGLRASEISASPIINPQHSVNSGLFASHEGLDGTALWAAATSGASAISVHLLACVLARIWSPPEATSIWVEIVEERRKEIGDAAENKGVHYRTPFAAMSSLEITRQQLAEWDASARAWLNEADKVYEKQQRKILLALSKIDLVVNNKSEVYTSVISAWKIALETLEKLVQGIPQQVQDGAALLALKAWHIYPDIDILGPNQDTLVMHDDLVASGGVVTLGILPHHQRQSRGVYWSLSLARLKHYGKPVKATRSTSSDAHRISFDELRVVVFGSLWNGWKDRACDDMLFGASFIVNLWESIETMRLSEPKIRREFESGWCQWMKSLSNAASALLDSDEEERDTAMRLAGLGRRMGASFLQSEGLLTMPPAFGMTSIEVVQSVLSEEGLIMLFRLCAARYSLSFDSVIIRYVGADSHIIRPDGRFNNYDDDEIEDDRIEVAARALNYASITAVPEKTREISPDGAHSNTSRYCRWEPHLTGEYFGKGRDSIKFGTIMHPDFPESKSHDDTRIQIWDELNSINLDTVQQTQPDGSSREYRRVIGEPDGTALFLDESLHLVWPNLQNELLETPIPLEDLATLSENSRNFISNLANLFKREIPDIGGSISPDAASMKPPPKIDTFQKTDSNTEFLLPQHDVGEAQQSSSPPSGIDPSASGIGIGGWKRPLRIRNIDLCLPERDFAPLQVLHCLSEVYKMLPHTTIPCNVVQRPLLSQLWAQAVSARLSRHLSRQNAPQSFHLNRRESFEAIASFETGYTDIRITEPVIARACGNSIFVVSSLLCDPYEMPHDHELQRIVGSIGRAGVALLVAPTYPQIKEPAAEDWPRIRHARFDGTPADSFPHTSLHLSFTGFETPIGYGNFGNCDTEIYYMETLVSLHDQGAWIADLDVLRTLQGPLLQRLEFPPCGHDVREKEARLTAIDNLSELLGRSQGLVLRGRGATGLHAWLSQVSVSREKW